MTKVPDLQKLLQITQEAVSSIYRDPVIANCLSFVLEEGGYDTKQHIVDDLEDESDCVIITNLSDLIQQHDAITYPWSSPTDEHTLYDLLCKIFNPALTKAQSQSGVVFLKEWVNC